MPASGVPMVTLFAACLCIFSGLLSVAYPVPQPGAVLAAQTPVSYENTQGPFVSNGFLLSKASPCNQGLALEISGILAPLPVPRALQALPLLLVSHKGTAWRMRKEAIFLLLV